MKTDCVGMLSALVASVCCLGPVLLVLLGLGSLGFGAVLGRAHWWFIGTAIALLAYAWRSYFEEAGRCRAARCEMAGSKKTRTALLLASTVVAVFVGLNLATYASHTHQATSTGAAPQSGRLASVVIPVEGMTCFTCELTVESSLKGLPGVRRVDANVKDAAAYVQYDPAQTKLEELLAAINKTGYRASRPKDI